MTAQAWQQAQQAFHRSAAERSALAPWTPPRRPPTPRVVARPATDVEVASCRSAKALLRKAEAAAWSAEMLYACGPLLTDHERFVELLALRVARDADYAVGWWTRDTEKHEPWKWQSGWHLRPLRKLTARDLTRLIEGEAHA